MYVSIFGQTHPESSTNKNFLLKIIRTNFDLNEKNITMTLFLRVVIF